MLDKVRKFMYNTRIGYEVSNTPDIDKLSLNKESTKESIDKLNTISNLFKKIYTKNYPDLQLPVIAGGAIRDTIFGLQPNDYDVFIDVSEETLQNQLFTDPEDFLLGMCIDFQKEYPNQDLFICRLGDDTYEKNETSFIVYELLVVDIGVVQLIGHKDKRISSDTPVDFLDYFDYDLVKCLYDVKDDKVYIHQDMEKFIKSLPYEYTRNFDGGRMENWMSRYYAEAKYLGKESEAMFKQRGLADGLYTVWTKYNASTTATGTRYFGEPALDRGLIENN